MKIIDAQIHIWSQAVTPPSGTHRKVDKFTAEQIDGFKNMPGFGGGFGGRGGGAGGPGGPGGAGGGNRRQGGGAGGQAQ